MDRPDIVVLAAGGILGVAWMTGVLAGIEDGAGLDLREARGFVGTSAGSIVAARLASGRSPRRPAAGVPTPDRDGVPDAEPSSRGHAHTVGAILSAAAGPLAPLALGAGTPARARVRAALLRRLPAGGRTMDDLRRRVTSWGPSFDGRLLVCAVDRVNGRRVVFGAPGAPPAGVPEAVEASCAIPGVFAPVRIGGHEYVDGGAWSLTNLDAAPAGRGDRVLCLDPCANPETARLSPMGLVRTGARTVAAFETNALARRGADVQRVGPDRRAGALMARGLMDPEPAVAVHAAGYRQGLALGRAEPAA